MDIDHFKIARPEVFIRALHPESAAGTLILERRLQRARYHSRVSPRDAEKIARLSWKVPDVSFSPASFYGLPLLTNFAGARCIHLCLPYTPKARWDLYDLLDKRHIPHPTAFVTSGTKLFFFWILEDIIPSTDFYRVYLLQHALMQLAHELDPIVSSLDVASLVPLIGTIQPDTQGFVSLAAYTGELLNNQLAEQILPREAGHEKLSDLRQHSRAIHELLALLNDRLMIRQPVVEDWLIFFGVSLCFFCTRHQLIRELQAIAISLEGRQWQYISDRYEPLVEDIARTATNGYIVHRGLYLPVDKPDWFSLVAGALDVTADEIERLGLRVLCGDTEEFCAISAPNEEHIRPVGDMKFVPVERLFFKEVG